MKRRNWIATLVLTASCATVPPHDEEIRMRIFGSDGEEITQIVPLGMAAPENARLRPGDEVLKELKRSVPWSWRRAMLVIVPHTCASRCDRRFELVIYDPERMADPMPMGPSPDKPRPTQGLYAAVDRLLASMKKAGMNDVRYGVFTMWKTPGGAWQGAANYEHFP